MIESDLSRRESSREAVGAESGGCVEVINFERYVPCLFQFASMMVVGSEGRNLRPELPWRRYHIPMPRRTAVSESDKIDGVH